MQQTISDLGLLLSLDRFAGQADIIDADARQQRDGSWRFDVTIYTNKPTAQHYADRWEVLTEEGEVLAITYMSLNDQTEQPCNQTMTGVMIPDNVTLVYLRAHDSNLGYAGNTITLPLQRLN
ncbi:hypothetical protein C4K68_05845 [Pokkaliibacter plantistimulans]|uniref:Uncharacterized protein n=1 Tax=Proteobacteria bacterium 228 TaxID=2083153 RepID=A0A2S5KVQ4_9PROT|nr:hypothetical protein [Pokkaliibacter plantistimulans]PPC78356.1 hypothetical protein C4K68_05845 [Pokkaliibacter plantistimulans]